MKFAVTGWSVSAVGIVAIIATNTWLLGFIAASYTEPTPLDSDVRALLPSALEWAHDSQGPVCGVYAVCRALGQIGIEVDPIALWNTEIVGEKEGSTPGQLMAAIERCGGRADLLQHVSMLELQTVGAPVIANVRGTLDRHVYDHWVCVQACEQGLLLFDGSGAGRLISPGEFLAGFSGVGIVVSRDRNVWYESTLARMLGIGAMLGIGWFGLAVGRGQALTMLHQFCRIGGVTVAMVMGGVLVFNTAHGFADGNRMALAPFEGVDFRIGGMPDLQAAVENEETLLVDARTPESVAHGTMNRAVNIPVFAGYYEIRDFTTRLERDTPIVVFCQSERCGYDEHIAGVLSRLGFTNVTASQPGYAEYMALQPAKAPISAENRTTEHVPKEKASTEAIATESPESHPKSGSQ